MVNAPITYNPGQNCWHTLINNLLACDNTNYVVKPHQISPTPFCATFILCCFVFGVKSNGYNLVTQKKKKHCKKGEGTATIYLAMSLNLLDTKQWYIFNLSMVETNSKVKNFKWKIGNGSSINIWRHKSTNLKFSNILRWLWKVSIEFAISCILA